jgi:hypothetical protein
MICLLITCTIFDILYGSFVVLGVHLLFSYQLLDYVFDNIAIVRESPDLIQISEGRLLLPPVGATIYA